MSKSVFTPQYELFLKVLRQSTERSGVPQTELAKALGMTQPMVSKSLRGERRLDVVELWLWCQAIQVPFPAFTARLDRVIRASKRR